MSQNKSKNSWRLRPLNARVILEKKNKIKCASRIPLIMKTRHIIMDKKNYISFFNITQQMIRIITE